MLMLSRSDPEERVLAADIAKKQRIPQKFLEQILLELARRGLVASRRGRNGGYALAKRPEQITIGDIIRIADGPLALIACASLTGYRRCTDCQDEKTCEINKVMRAVRDATSAILDHTTLEDAAGKQTLLKKLAALPTGAPFKPVKAS